MANFSLTENEISSARRRAVENAFDGGGFNDGAKYTTGYTAILKDAREIKANIRPSKSRKSRNSFWVSAVFKFLGILAFVFLLYKGIQWWRHLGNSGGGETTVEGKYVKTSAVLQIQLDEVNKNLKDLISSMREMERNREEADLKLKALDVRTTDVLEKMERNREEADLKLKTLDVRTTDVLEKMERNGEEADLKLKALDVRTTDVLEKMDAVFRTEEELIVENDKGIDGNAVRTIVLEEIERHAADGGVGMVDHALATIGAMVLKHSAPYGGWRWGFCSFNGVCDQAQKMITPSFGEPGQCLPLDGGSGFVEIKLASAIFPEAVTLEHVDESVTYSRNTAPRQCSVSGWLRRGKDATGVKVDPKKKFLLAEFMYDLEKRNLQTYKVVDSASSNLVDTVRLDVKSNYGGAYTCIYRLRVHGHEPSSIPTL